MQAMLEIRFTATGARVRNFPEWPDWVFEVDLDWQTRRTANFRAIPPTGRRRKNARTPPAAVEKRVKSFVESMYRHGMGGFRCRLTSASKQA
jgi:hypothetical protein